MLPAVGDMCIDPVGRQAFATDLLGNMIVVRRALYGGLTISSLPALASRDEKRVKPGFVW